MIVTRRMRRCSFLVLAPLFLSLSSIPIVSAAALWNLQENSKVGFVATQGGAPVEGVFERFEAKIAFSADDLAGSMADIEIDIASVNSQSKDRDDAIRSPGLFDTNKWPRAAFRTKTFRKVGPNAFEAEGTLTMRGISRPVVLPFTRILGVDPETNEVRARVQGKLTVQRLDYGIGQGAWKDTSIVGNAVTIVIDLNAKR